VICNGDTNNIPDCVGKDDGTVVQVEDPTTKHREFDAYRWVTLDEAVAGAVDFKRVAYDAVAAHFRDIVDKRRRPATP